ncbi:DNA helicase-2/ATP-dependent DNA helicase PcrA [Scopulibacillus darangshiensis]|uniref:DNA helicase-2/ATP-dependent DNA helicase PcrA n=1 Tax=Scopulibacillus darangshiensis TaxID=442528 RepID=A0A4V2SN50_9BACL|nr:RNA polymerase recycling motor HelD [Scopulibacillus darangshiensis]TCP29846.1 DNA helicase-2/ATP-dependent DNA helicase PcrA [Scopulibacillus darangshiensis]
MSGNNKEWQEERERLVVIKGIIEQKQDRLKDQAGDLRQGIISFRKNFWDDVTVNIDEPDDIIETEASIRQQAEVLSERERNHGRMHARMKTLDRLQHSPYFGRIDFLEENDREADQIYIGIASLMDEKDEDFLIYDWRAPISSLYYDYYPGPVHYRTPEGSISGDMMLKRQFIIKHGVLEGLFDTGVTIGDQLLQELLGAHASTKMKNIVATIQKEQNQIIRNEKSKILIVQGVAGSGKTSAALQRVAYLLYTHRETLNNGNMVLFSPNPLFNSYVRSVLPELGEENIRQTTYNEYIEERLGDSFRFEDSFEQMENFLVNGDSADSQNRMANILIKSSLAFKKVIDKYTTVLAREGLIFKDITFRGRTLLEARVINDYFYGLSSSMSIRSRMEFVAEWLLAKLKEIERSEWQEQWVESEVQLLDKEDYLVAFKKLQKKNPWTDDSFDDFDREQEILGEMVVKRRFKPIKDDIKRLAFIDIKSTYCQLFKSGGEPFVKADTENWDQICKFTLEQLDRNDLTWEDVTPYLYFQTQLLGRNIYSNIRHVSIDEAQDYSPFQFAYLKVLFPNAKMTLLGDFNQAIYAHALNTASFFSSEMSITEPYEKITLTRSYRSTRPIVEFTKKLVKEGERIVPFNRDGDKPTLTQAEDAKSVHKKILDRVNNLQSKGLQTIAVICKTMAECIEAYDELRNRTAIQLMDRETHAFTKGTVIIPAYLAKGIEFDAVIIYDASRTKYSKESERKLFYTACTRAMHELHLFSLGEVSPFLEKIPHSSYNKLV